MVIDVEDTSGLAAFWAAALGWEIGLDEPGEASVWPAGFDYPGTGALPLEFISVPRPKAGKNRIHLDLASQSAAHQAEIVGRARDLGAQLADIGQGDVPWVVLTDPEGKVSSCVLEPRPVYSDTGPVAAVAVDSAVPAGLCRTSGFKRVAGVQLTATARSSRYGRRRAAGRIFEFLPTVDPRRGKNRVHLDVAPAKGEDHAAAVESLLRAGAVRADVGQGSDVSWAVLADPEGNEFCVLSPR